MEILVGHGAETAGIVNAVNPLLAPEHIIDIMKRFSQLCILNIIP